MSIGQPAPKPNHQAALDSIGTRQTLLERLKHWSDQTSWQEFFDRYWRLIYNVAIKAGLTDAEAQEVVQETVICVAKKIAGFQTGPNRGSFSAWLLRLTRWRISDQFRKRRRAQVPGLPAGDVLRSADDTGSTSPIERVPDPAGTPLERLWEEEWEKNIIEAALERVKRKVSPRQFQMFDLHVLQGLGVRDAARILKVSVASVYVAKSRISRQVKQTVKTMRQEVHGWG